MSARKLRNTWWTDVTLGKRRIRFRAPVNTKEMAEAFGRKLQAAFTMGEDYEALLPKAARPAVAPPPVATFDAFSAHWEETYVKANNKPSEQQTKEYVLRVHLRPAFGKLTLRQIAVPDVEAYKAAKLAKGLAPKSINNHLVILQKCLRCANEWGLLPIVPKFKELKVAPPPFDFLSTEESDRLIADCDDARWRSMILLGLRTGMRIGEMLGLEWRHVDLERRILTVEQSLVRGVLGSPKNGRRRHVPITDELARELLPLRCKKGYVFRQRGGAPRTYQMANKALRRNCRRAELREVSWHVLRHTFASQLAEASVPMPAVQQLLGHSTLAMTMRYAHIAPSLLRDAVSILDASSREGGPRQHFGQHLPISNTA